MRDGIGIGCFWFEPKEMSADVFEDFNSKEFLSNIKSALESVDNVSSVEIFGEGNSILLSDFEGDEEGEEIYFPIFIDVVIAFDLYLPFRVQNSYSKGFSRQKGTENFRVIISYGIEMPVVYIYQKNLKDDITDSSAPVMFIREYLEDKLQNDKNCHFRSLGPSPFHADVFLNVLEGKNSEILSSQIEPHSRGYDDVSIKITVEKDTDPLGVFIERYQGILGAYYALVLKRNRSLSNDAHVFNAVQDLIERGKTKRFIKNFYQEKSLIDSVYEKILDDKLNRIAIERDVLQKTRDSIFDKDNVFYSFVEKEIQDISKIPVDEVREILNISESRRQKFMQNSATLLSGLIGGIIGAVAGSFLTYSLAQQPNKDMIKIEREPAAVLKPTDDN